LRNGEDPEGDINALSRTSRLWSFGQILIRLGLAGGRLATSIDIVAETHTSLTSPCYLISLFKPDAVAAVVRCGSMPFGEFSRPGLIRYQIA